MQYQRKTNETRQRLIDAFFRRYQHKPIEKITIQEVADGAGVHRATFYQYFSDVYALLEYEEARIFDAFQAEILSVLRAEPRRLFDTTGVQSLLHPFYQVHGERLQILLGENGDPRFQHRVRETMEEVLALGLGLPDLAGKEGYLVRFLVAGVLRTLTSWYRERDLPFEELVGYLHGLLSQAIPPCAPAPNPVQ